MLSSSCCIRPFVLLVIIFCLRPVTYGNNIKKHSAEETILSGTTQAPDSLRLTRLLNNGLQEVKINEHIRDKTLFFKTIDSAVRLGRKTGRLVFTGHRLIKIGDQLRKEARFPLAIHVYKTGIEIGKETKNTKLLILSYNKLGVVFRRIDNYKKAMDYHLKAYHLATQTHDSISEAMAVNSIGNVYLMLGDLKKALEYFKQSLQLEQNRKNPIGIAINLNNVAQVYKAEGYYNKALKYFELSLDINKRINAKRGIAICNNDIANLLKEQGKYRDALNYSLKAIKISHEINDVYNLAYAYIETGSLYSKLKNFGKAFQYLEPGVRLAKKIHARSILENGYDAIFNTYMGMEKYKEAVKYLKIKQLYHDSLLSLDVRKSITRMQIEFNTEKQKNQIQLQEQKTKVAMLQVKKQKYLLYFAWSAFAILLFALGFVSFYLFNKNKQNKLLLEKNQKIKKAQSELQKSNEALQQAIVKAENSTKAKTSFLTNISHEIRTPLNSVLGFSDILYSMTNDETQKKYLQSIKSSGESLLGLINDILDLSKIEEGNIDLEFKEMDIRRILDDLTNIFSLELLNKSLHFVAKADDDFPQLILFEEARLKQILLNIIGNAIKFTPQGSISVEVHAKKENKPQRISLIVEVTDTGIGISPDEQAAIFKPFYQGKTSEKTKGTGLGLAISQRLVKAMNGEITLQSTPGKGSRFSVIFHNVQVNDDTTVNSNREQPIRRENKKCLFINQPHPLKDELKEIFSSHLFAIEDVGIDFSKARKSIPGYRLIVFCCLEEEVLQNARNIFEKENMDKRHLFLILNINKAFIVDKKKAVSIHLFNRPANEIKSELHEFIRQFDEDECAAHLFNIKEIENNKVFFDKINHLYGHYFEPANNTKMFDKIEHFNEHLQQIAIAFHLTNLLDYSNDLDHYLRNFDILAIEKQLRIIKKAFETIVHEK